MIPLTWKSTKLSLLSVFEEPPNLISHQVSRWCLTKANIYVSSQALRDKKLKREEKRNNQRLSFLRLLLMKDKFYGMKKVWGSESLSSSKALFDNESSDLIPLFKYFPSIEFLFGIFSSTQLLVALKEILYVNNINFLRFWKKLLSSAIRMPSKDFGWSRRQFSCGTSLQLLITKVQSLYSESLSGLCAFPILETNG